MADELLHLHQQLTAWANDAVARGWLDGDATAQLDDTTLATPGNLFDSAERPLVVGLFGGTGVGKSTLLNRLAREPIARTSVERPTSTDVTAYVHRSVTVDHLPDEFPMQRLRTALHQNADYRSVLWIDMPDFDSVEASHRTLVDLWLPHIDVVVYVVSPERYRDDQGWRLLLEHGASHAWLFVINHWDRGDSQQRDDFHQLLSGAGLPDPMIFCTDSRDPDAAPATDEFAQLEHTIQRLANQQLVEQLESRGVLQRWRQLQSTAATLRASMVSGEQLTEHAAGWPAHWQSMAAQLSSASDWRVPQFAQQHAERQAPFLLRLLPGSRAEVIPGGDNTSSSHTNTDNKQPTLIDATFLDRVAEAIDSFVQQAQLPVRALDAHIAPLKEALPQRLQATLQDALHQSMAQPGTRLQRGAYKTLGILASALPLAAMGWIGFRVVDAFREGATQPAAYLSSNFAINSALLLALAWCVPAFLQYKIKPSRERAAARGLRNGVQSALQQVDTDFQQCLQQATDERQQIDQQLENLWANKRLFDDEQLPAAVRRMLMQADTPADQSPNSVRATAHNDTSSAPVS